MKKTNKYIAFAIACLIGMSSCKKELDLQPIDEFNEANAYLDISDIKLGVNTAHGRYAYINDMYVNSLVSDELKIGPNNSGTGALTHRFQYASDNTSGGDVIGALANYYALIDQANRVLERIPTVTATPSQEPLRNIYSGQMLALRAIGHFELLQHYCAKYDPAGLGVPVMLSSNPLLYPARNTMGEVMAAIDADFVAAKALLPNPTAADFNDTAINKLNIAAMQARVALYKRDYDGAITFATEVINSGIRPLNNGLDFVDQWSDASNGDVLLRRRYENSGAVGSLWSTQNTVLWSPSDKLTNSYDPADIRLDTYIGTFSGGRYVNKFIGSSRGVLVVDAKIIRTAEMYLIRAEANARKAAPDLAAGAADLNELRSNRIAGYVDQTFASAQALIDAVMEERFKELAFEGFRFFDLKRNDLPVQRSATDANPAWQTLDAGDYRFVFPITNDEILANPNFTQNPGY